MSLLATLGCRGCQVCPLDSHARNIKSPRMQPSGAARGVELYVLGEAPGETEDQMGRQFVGKSGDLLRPLVERHGLKVRWSNIIRCRPPDNRTPTGPEIQACGSHTEDDLSAHTPKVLLLVGAPALRWATGDSQILKWRGLPIPMFVGGKSFWALPVLHPAFVLRSQDNRYRGQDPAERLLKLDVDLAASMLDWAPPPPPIDFRKTVMLPPTEDNIRRLLNEPKLGYDLETNSLQPYSPDPQLRNTGPRILTAAFYGRAGAIAFPVEHPEAAPNKPLLRRFLAEYKGKVVAHNLPFELVWSLMEFGPEVVLSGGIEWHDSMCAVRDKNSRESPINLDDSCRIFLGSRIKDLTGVDPERWREVPLPKFLEYNAFDARAAFELHDRLVPEEWLEYRRLVDVSITNALMSWKGVPVKAEALKAMEEKVRPQYEEAVEQIHALPESTQWARTKGKPLDIESPAQVNAFLKMAGVDESLLESTDEESLREIDHPVIAPLLQARRYGKLLSTYIEGWMKAVQRDGKFHPSYTSCKVATGRLSASDPSIMNVPKRKDKWIREPVDPGPGFGVLSLDYNQIELRDVAMLSRDPVLVQEMWTGQDLHKRWADRTIELHSAILDRIGEEYNLFDEDKIRKALRDEVKRGITFALPYGAHETTPGRILKLPKDISLQISHEYWEHYPGLKAWQTALREAYLRSGYIEFATTGRKRTGLLDGNEPINSPVQGTASDFVTAAMVRLAKRAVETGDLTFVPVFIIHDDLTFIVPDSQRDFYCKEIGKEMAKISHPLINVPLKIEASYGATWYQQETVAVFSSTDYGHRRSRSAVAPPVQTEVFLGSAWTRFNSGRTAEASGGLFPPPRIPLRRPSGSG